MVRTKPRNLKQKAPEIESKARRMADRLRYYYRLGQEVVAGDLPPKELAEIRGVSDHLMRKFRRFAREYTPRDLEALCNTFRPNGLPLQWGHVNYLLGIHDKQERKAMQGKAIENGWTAPQLNVEIRKKFGSENGHGRSMMKPATPTAGLQQLMAEAQMWIRRCEVVMIEVQRVSQKGLGSEFRQRAEETVAVLEEVQKTARLVKNGLVAVLPGKPIR